MQKPVKGNAAHQDTDETMVLGILSAVILFFTILTVGSYAEDTETLTEQKLLSKKTLPLKEKRDSYLINTNNPSVKVANKEILKM